MLIGTLKFSLLLLPLFLLGLNRASSAGEDPALAAEPSGVRVGDAAPDFTLTDQHGKVHSLAEYRDQKNVVLYFYPKDETTGCTREACGFRDKATELRTLGAAVFGVSVDSVESHVRFADKYDLNFLLLSDPEGKVSRAYGALSEKGTSKRFTFLIDRQGVVRKIYTKVDVNEHASEVARFIQENMR
jgi:peroxiredoxin Q/BCP